MPPNCPYLGLIDDPKTNANFPSSANACHAVSPQFIVDLDYQRSRCLRETHQDCPGFITGWESGIPKSIRYSGALPTEQKFFSKKWVWIAIASISAIVLIIGFSGWIPGFSFPFNINRTPDHSASLSLQKATHTLSVENTDTITPISEETIDESGTASTDAVASSTSTRTKILTRTKTTTPTSTSTPTLTPTRFQAFFPTNTLRPTSVITPIVSTPKPSATITSSLTPTKSTTSTATITRTPTTTRTATTTKTITRTPITIPTSTSTPTITHTVTPTETTTPTPTETETLPPYP